ncbi:Mitochondrial-processing peptidase subunit alpha [Chytridiales sp. JEL 0842]|nr:Mitochondrial-processing peptidase subunit alpha [Chytridiales sp. JEL 0842]
MLRGIGRGCSRSQRVLTQIPLLPLSHAHPLASAAAAAAARITSSLPSTSSSASRSASFHPITRRPYSTSPSPSAPTSANSTDAHKTFDPLTESCPTEVTTLPNGVRVASQDALGHFVTVGVFVDVGTRYETDQNAGSCHVMDRLAFKSSENYDSEAIGAALEKMGGNVMAESSREAIMYQAAVFRPDLPEMTKLLADVVLRPRITAEEVEEVKEVCDYEVKNLQWKMDAVLPEKVHQVAFGGLTTEQESAKGTGLGQTVDVIRSGHNLGRPLMADPESLNKITPESLKEFRSTWYTADRIVVAGVGMPHQELVKLAEEHFGKNVPVATAETKARQKSFMQPAKYTGGTAIIDTTGGPISPNPDDRPLTYVHIIFEAPSMNDPDIYALATLLSLMGGGGSFSAGGPGKGMYTRLYTQVLNQYFWVESCNMFSYSYLDTGLFGISAAVPPSKDTHAHIIPVLCSQLLSMTTTIHPTELSRAKNQLKSNLLMSLESRAVELGDIGRQVLSLGKRVDVNEMCRRIDALTDEDLKRVARRVVLGSNETSPLRYGDKDFKDWVRTGDGRPTVLVHGQLVGKTKDALWNVDNTIRDWGLGGSAFERAGAGGKGRKFFWGR